MAKPLSRPQRIAVRILAASPGFSANLNASFTLRFSCSILRNRASFAAGQNEAPARGIPGLLRLATRISGASPTSGIISCDVKQPRAQSLVNVIYRHSRLGRVPEKRHRECPILCRLSKILLSNTMPILRIEKGCTPVWGLRPKSCPFVIRVEFAIAISFRARFLPIFHASCS